MKKIFLFLLAFVLILSITPVSQVFAAVPRAPKLNIGSVYYIRNESHARYMDVYTTSGNGANVEGIWFGNYSSQRWKLLDAGDGYYYLQPESDTYCYLDRWSVGDNPSNVCLYTASGSDTSKWKIWPTNDGLYIIENKAYPNQVINIANTSDSRTNIFTSTYSGAWYEKWQFEQVLNTSKDNYAPPIALNTTVITSPYGMRNGSMHHGVDIGTTGGLVTKPLYATANGLATYKRYIRNNQYTVQYGNYVELPHDTGGTGSRYAHLSFFAFGFSASTLPKLIGNYSGTISTVGTKTVERGYFLGRSGDTGNSTGTHLHYEHLTNFSSNTRDNPASYVKLP
jgi:hypothetical protein